MFMSRSSWGPWPRCYVHVTLHPLQECATGCFRLKKRGSEFANAKSKNPIFDDTSLGGDNAGGGTDSLLPRWTSGYGLVQVKPLDPKP